VGDTAQGHLAAAHLRLSSLVNKGEQDVFPLRAEKLEWLMHLLFLHGSETQVTGVVQEGFPSACFFSPLAHCGMAQPL